MNNRYYLGILNRMLDRIHVRPEYKEVGKRFFLHDNATLHKIAACASFLENLLLCQSEKFRFPFF